MRAQTATDDKVLGILREMDERVLHTDIIHPLLRELGAHHIRYVHGAFERGKDFLYLAPSFFGTTELVVCQVKNDKLSGRASDISRSTAAFLLQAQQCKQTAVFHPTANSKLVPDRVVLISTYALPDAPLADADHLLSKVRSECTIIGPEELLKLIRTHLSSVYSSLIFPGNSAALALQRYISQHREADAFELSAKRPLESFYVNIGVSCGESAIGRLLDGTLTSPTSGTRTISESQFFTFWRLQELLLKSLGEPPWLDVGKSMGKIDAILARPPSERATVVVTSPSHVAIRESVAGYITSQQQNGSVMKSRDSHAHLISSTIDVLKKADDLIDRIARRFEWKTKEREEHDQTTTTLFREVMPEALLQTAENVLISGQAGAGKTCLARMIARSAMDSGLTCVYFPCSSIREADQSLDDAMRSFLAQLAPDVPAGDFDRLLHDVHVIVLDGCDEAASFKTCLADDIRSLASPKSVSVSLSQDQLHELRIPRDLRSAISVEDNVRGESKVVVREALSDSDMTRMAALNANSLAEAPLKKLHEQLRSGRRKIIATARSGARFDLSPSFADLTLSPFDNEQVELFFRSWCKVAEIDAEPVLSFLASNPYIRDICRVPINATIVAAAYENGYDLPHSRVEVYHKRFDLLLDRWDRVRHVLGRNTISKSDKYRFLSRLALTLHRHHARTFTRRQAKIVWDDGFQRLYPQCTIDDLLGELRHANTVITNEGAARYSLGHLSFQEYLAAQAIASGQHVEFIVKRLDDPWWQQVALFYAGIAGDLSRLVTVMQRRTAIRNPGGLLSAMMDEARYTSDVMRSLIGELLADCDMDDDVFHEDEEDLNASAHSDESIEELLQEQEIEDGKSIEIEGLGPGELVVESDDNEVSGSQQDMIDTLESMKDLGPKCVAAVVKLCRADVKDVCERIRDGDIRPYDVFSDYGPKYSISKLIRANIALTSVTIPAQNAGEGLFDVYVEMSWLEDSVAVVQWANGKITKVDFM